MTVCSLEALEASLSLLQQTKLGRNRSDVYMSEQNVAAMNIDDTTLSTALGAVISGLLRKVRILRNDVEDLERCAKVLEDVGFLDDALRVASGEIHVLDYYRDDLEILCK